MTIIPIDIFSPLYFLISFPTKIEANNVLRHGIKIKS